MLSIDEYLKERVEIGCCVPFFHLRFLLSFPPLLRLSGRSKVNPRAETESNHKVTHKPFPGLRRHGGEPIFFYNEKSRTIEFTANLYGQLETIADMQESKLEDESDQFYKATLPFCEPEPVLRKIIQRKVLYVLKCYNEI